MPKPLFDAKAELNKLNAQLKAADAGCSVKLIGKRLYLAATLPPKPGTAYVKPRNQRIALKIYANAAGFKRAKAEALKLSSELALDAFSWENWLDDSIAAQGRTTGEWIKAFEADYFQRRNRNPQSETTWDYDYWQPLKHLPNHAPLTFALLRQTIEARSKPDSRTRKRYCMAYGALLKFAGIEGDLKPLKGTYSPTAISDRHLPSTKEIEKYWEKLRPPWRNVYGLMAVFGLRNHEVFHLDHSTLVEGIATIQENTKTGFHEAWPYHPEWLDKFELRQPTVKLPNITVKRNRDYGARVAETFKRHEIPFTPYVLRHAWAARTATEYGLEIDVAARMMGHSVTEHSRTYHRFIKRSQMQMAVERSLTRREHNEPDQRRSPQ